MGVKLEGDWDKFLNLKNLNIVKQMDNALVTAGEVVRRNIVKGIQEQRIEGPSLKSTTLEAKSKPRKRGKDTIPSGSNLKLIDQGDYVSSFATEQVSETEVHVGSNHDQARALEFGYAPRNLPARPHVGPAVERSMDEMGEVLRESFEGAFKK